MGRLDDVDLSQKLGRKEYEKRLEAGQERLEALRLQLGGLIGDGRLGPPVLLLFEGVELGGRMSVAKHLQSSLAGPLTTVLRRCGWRLAVLEVRGHGCWWRYGRHT